MDTQPCPQTPESLMSSQLQQLFKSCDLDTVDRDAFRDLCRRLNISHQDADIIFEDLDLDKDGRISFAEFSSGFANFIATTEGGAKDPPRGVLTRLESECVYERDDIQARHHAWTALTNEAEKMGVKQSDEEKLKWLLSELQTTEQRHLVPYLQNAVEELLSNLHHLQDEKNHLEETWRREKSEHEKHLKRMEEELDSQVKEAEMKSRLKAQAEVEDERRSLQYKMDAEMDNIQAHYALFEKVDAWLQHTQPGGDQERDGRMDEVRVKLDEAVHENRQLRMSLLDTQTNIALMRGELLQLRTMYEEKCRELSSERERYLEVLQEHDHLSRQLNMLHDANKRLLDSHDALRNAVETPNKSVLGGTPRRKTGSIIGDYLDIGYPTEKMCRFEESEEQEEEEASQLRRTQSMDVTFPIKRRFKIIDKKSMRQFLNQSDSGVSTSRDPFDEWDASPRDTTSDQGSTNDEEPVKTKPTPDGYKRSSKKERPVSMPPCDELNSINSADEYVTKKSKGHHSKEDKQHRLKASLSQDSLLETETFPRKRICDIKKQLGIEDKPTSWNRTFPPKHPQTSTPRHSLSPRRMDSECNATPTPLPRTSKVVKINGENHEKEPIEDDITENGPKDEFEADGPAEQTFKVIFVGDAGVGKSSFALRISKGVFVRHVSSTLGVDFLMRTIRVDGRNVAVQLWDTAGQERFRSVTKAYFRKADGVMLLYDCTCEQSFLNVRQWVEDIDVSCFYRMMARSSPSDRKTSMQRIPLMIIGNKTDLRESAIQSGITCIRTENGEKLAKDCDTTFMEASAKDGSNVLPALANLVRSMAAQQDLQMSASALQLTDINSKKSNTCCRK